MHQRKCKQNYIFEVQDRNFGKKFIYFYVFFVSLHKQKAKRKDMSSGERAPIPHRRIPVPSTHCVAGTCIPIAFANDGIRDVSAANATRTLGDDDGEQAFLESMIAATVGAAGSSTAGGSRAYALPRRLAKPEPAPDELPLDVFPRNVLYDVRPCVLPDGFTLVPTPTEYGNVLVTPGVDGKPRKRPWHSNLWVLWMPGFTRPVIGRHLRIPNTAACKTAHEWRLLEGIFFAYSIKFHVRMLAVDGVKFYPAFVPSTPHDVNYWARQTMDCTLAANTVPPTPPGWCIPFSRLPLDHSVQHVSDKKQGYVLTSSYGGEHPVIRGERMFPPLGTASGDKPTYQDGGIGFVVYRPNYQELGIVQEDDSAAALENPYSPLQTVMLYTRVAFTKDALAEHDVQLSKINSAIQFALVNSPTDDAGRPWISMTNAAALDSARAETMYGNIFEVAPADMRRVLETTTEVNAVDVKRDVLTTLTRVIMANEGVTQFEAAHTEARFRVALAEQCLASEASMASMASTGSAPLQPSDLSIVMPVLEDSMAYHQCASETVTESTTAAASATATGAVAGTVVEHAASRFQYVHQERVFCVEDFPYVQAQYACALQAVEARRSVSSCSPILNDIAPPDAAAYGAKSVLILAFAVNLRLGASEARVPRDEQRKYRRIAGDLVTRFMWDMMLFDPSLAVVSTHKETLLSLYTDKAPGLLCVKPTRESVAVKKTNTSDNRKTRNPHPALMNFSVETVSTTPKPPPIAPIPEISTEEARANPLLQEWLRGPLRPTAVPGCLASIYRPGGAKKTEVAGTCHAWPLYGALVNARIMNPQTASNPWGFFGSEVTLEQRKSALSLLFAPLYNAAHNEIYKKDGWWTDPSAVRRTWNKAYGMDLRDLHYAAGWRLYPAFASEYAEPRAVHIWELKKLVEALLQFALRYGRVLRRLLGNHRRKIRSDYHIVIFRNYFYDTGKRFPDAPVLRLFVSALNAYSKSVILGEQPPPSHRKRRLPGAPVSARTNVHCDGSDEDEDDDGDKDEAAGGLLSFGTRHTDGAGAGAGASAAGYGTAEKDMTYDDGLASDAVDPMAAFYDDYDYDEITTTDLDMAPKVFAVGSCPSMRRRCADEEDDDDMEDGFGGEADGDGDGDDQTDDDDVVDDEHHVACRDVSGAPCTVATRMREVSSVMSSAVLGAAGGVFTTRVSTYALEPGSAVVRPHKRLRTSSVINFAV